MSRRTKGRGWRPVIRLSSMNVAQGQSGAQNMGHMTSAGYLGQARVMLQTVHILTPVLVRIQYTTWSRGCGYQLLCDDIMIQYTSVDFGLPSIDLSYNNMLTRFKIRVCCSSEHEGSRNHTYKILLLLETSQPLDTGH